MGQMLFPTVPLRQIRLKSAGAQPAIVDMLGLESQLLVGPLVF
jgi:hypothetical protein